MSFSINFPLFSIVLGLICSVVSSMVSGKTARNLTLLLCTVVCITAGMTFYYNYQTGEAVTYMMGHFPAPWGNEIRFGLLEPLFVMVFSFVMFMCIIGGNARLHSDLQLSKMNLYFVMMDLIEVALFVLVYTNDVFTGFVFIEICTMASCGILMIRQLGRTTLASVRYMIFSLLGSGLFLFGVVILYNVTGHLLMPNLKEAVAELWQTGEYHLPLTVVISMITLGLGVKSGLFPFHYWMADTYGYATPCSSGVLSGLISKGYIFLLIKVIVCAIGVDVFYASGACNVVFVLGLCGMFFGSVAAIRENEINRMVAFSSAAQIGYIYMGIGISPGLGIVAALLHMLAHAITKPAIFLSSAQLAAVSDGRMEFQKLEGAGHRNKAAGVLFAIGAMSMVGLPFTIGFISKYQFALAGLQEDWKLLPTLIMLAVSTILNTAYFLRTVVRIYKPSQGGQHLTMSQQPHYVVGAGCLVALNVALGICGQPLLSVLERGLSMM